MDANFIPAKRLLSNPSLSKPDHPLLPNYCRNAAGLKCARGFHMGRDGGCTKADVYEGGLSGAVRQDCTILPTAVLVYILSLRPPLPQAMPSQRPCSSLRKDNCQAASRQAECGLEPFQVIWPRPNMNDLRNCLTKVHSSWNTPYCVLLFASKCTLQDH